jgi:hypothetical protein
MWYQAGADAVLLIHFGFILFVLLGGFLAWKWAWVPWLHLPAALWGALIEFSGGICPLTPLENRLRQAAGGDGYPGSFIERYLLPVIYPAELTRDLQLLLGLLVIAVNLGVYGLLWIRRKNKNKNKSI